MLLNKIMKQAYRAADKKMENGEESSLDRQKERKRIEKVIPK